MTKKIEESDDFHLGCANFFFVFESLAIRSHLKKRRIISLTLCCNQILLTKKLHFISGANINASCWPSDENACYCQFPRCSQYFLIGQSIGHGFLYTIGDQIVEWSGFRQI